MISTSTRWKTEQQNDNRDYTLQIVITLSTGTVLTLGNSNIMESTFKLESGTSESGKFTIGSAVIGKCAFAINNIYDDYSTYNFTGAKVVPYVGYTYSDGTTELYKKGTFYVYDKPAYSDGVITLSSYGPLEKLDRKFTGTITFPTTRGALVQLCASQCGVSLLSSEFTGYAESVTTFDYSTMTCREIMGYVAQVCGYFLKETTNGLIQFAWYDIDAFKNEADLDGGDFLYVNESSNADGGNFTTYTESTNYDGGTYSDLSNKFVINGASSYTVDTDTVTVTGIRVIFNYTTTSTDADGNTEETTNTMDYAYGSDGYVLTIENNPLMTLTNYQSIALALYNKIAGTPFRPLTVSALSDPCIEAGDWGYFSDWKGNTYKFFATNVSFTCGDYETFTCDAESPAETTNGQFSVTTKLEQYTKDQIAQEKSQRQQAIENLNTVIENSSGTYTTEVTKPDGSTIYYLHDKETLAASTIVWKMTAEAWAVSTDGGAHYSYGMEVNGTVIANILQAVGVNADWINAGTITGRTISGGTITGSVINGGTGSFSGSITASSGSIGSLVINSDGTLGVSGGSLYINTNSSYPISTNGTLGAGNILTSGITILNGGSISSSGSISCGSLVSAGVVQCNGGSTCFYTVGSAIGSGNAFTGSTWNSGVLQFYKSYTFQIASSSDERFKQNIQDIPNATEILLAIHPKQYSFKDGMVENGKGIHYGLVANELIESLEDLGIDYKKLNLIEEFQPDEGSAEHESTNGGTGYRVWYENLHALEISTIQELYKKNQELQEKVKEQQSELDSVKAEIEAIKQKLGM